MHRIAKILLPAIALLCNACTNAPLSYNSYSITSNSHLTRLDATHRLVLSASVNKNHPGEKDNYVRRFCAEPPPDVMTALAASFSLAASAQTSSPAEKAAALQLAGSLAQNTSTIERTQTINILREMMYRNCERYLSGGINEAEFIIQAARDQRTIVQVLAIEQLTGVYRAQASAVTATAQAVSTGGDTIKTLDNAHVRATTLQADAKKAQQAAADAQPPDVKCHAIPPAADGDDAAAKVNRQAKIDKCTAADEAQKAADEADAHYKRLAKTLDATNAAAQTATAASVAEQPPQKQPDGNSGKENSEPSEHIAKTVWKIVRESSQFNEAEMACIVQLRHWIQDEEYFEQFCTPKLGEIKASPASAMRREIRDHKKTLTEKYTQAANKMWKHLEGKKSRSDALNALAERPQPHLTKEEKTLILEAETKDALFKALANLKSDRADSLTQSLD